MVCIYRNRDKSLTSQCTVDVTSHPYHWTDLKPLAGRNPSLPSSFVCNASFWERTISTYECPTEVRASRCHNTLEIAWFPMGILRVGRTKPTIYGDL